MDGYNSNDMSIVDISSDKHDCIHTQLKCEVKEAMEQIERGEYMSIDEAFDRVIVKYVD
ncbi:MAG: hypothetical protein Q8O20_06075 [Sulfuricurvum sp.]|uniref:hypothetical protein n=1 Tax=Sulfuricurvum sp. TaxID=2025608 RepID=UPI002735BBAC|nr:hypothetical protein [Sulfuricurvum sp.]MDP2850625.1 hypothetical protein [Sulfuricurvum sp.]